MKGKRPTHPVKIFCSGFVLLAFISSTCLSLLPTWASGSKTTGEAAFAETCPFDLSYSDYGHDLAKYVEGESGLVHYRQWQKDAAGLSAFIAQLTKLDPAIYQKWRREEQLAFWINAYNALAIKSVLDHYPVKQTVDYYPANSIRQFNDGWEVLSFTVMGKPITLYDIEHDRLRLGFKDPRVHFAVASASMDSARISKKPYIAAGLDVRLDDRARRFFAQPDTFVLDAERGIVRISKIFSWFTLDFATCAGHGKMAFPPPKDEDIILDYVSHYLPDNRRAALDKLRRESKLNFDYLPYDWALNDADQAASVQSK